MTLGAGAVLIGRYFNIIPFDFDSDFDSGSEFDSGCILNLILSLV